MPGVNGTVYAACSWDQDGPGSQPPLLVVSGSFSAAGASGVANIATWDGTSWSSLGPGLQRLDATGAIVEALTVFQGKLIAGGSFTHAGSKLVNYIASWDGVEWQAIGGGVTAVSFPSVRAALAVYNGELIVGGNFTSAGGLSASRIARWNGVQWAIVGCRGKQPR